jgi:hypothetical protein
VSAVDEGESVSAVDEGELVSALDEGEPVPPADEGQLVSAAFRIYQLLEQGKVEQVVALHACH